MTVCVASLGLAIFMTVIPAMAQTNNNGDYIFLLASGFLCASGDSSTCPATVRSSDGDSYEMSGAGMFDAQNKSVKAAGTLNHKSTNGNVLETGAWLTSDLISFGSYGIAPAALMQKGPAFGTPQIGPKRLPSRSGPLPTGGLAIFRILLMPISGTTKTVVLQVNCALGDVPRERSVEGIRLTLEKNGAEFSEEVSGRVMFLAMRPAVSAPVKPPQQKAAPESAEPPSN